MLQENSAINLEEEFDKSIKQRLAEQFETLARIPFISSGKIFKRFFDLDTGFDVAVYNADGQVLKEDNPFNRERRLTERVQPKNTRMTLQGEQP